MTKQEIGEFVRVQRAARGLTQKELAELLCVRRQAIVEIEKAQTNYGIDILSVVLEGLGYTIFPKSLLLPKFNFKNVPSNPNPLGI